MNLFIDMMSLRIAPTAGREAAAQSAGLILVTAAALLLSDRPAVQFGVPFAYAVYAALRVVVAAKQNR